jgi:predicted TIM-barrel fold metal-dependent hydrolase
LTRWPGIAWVFSHGGGATAMLAQRIVALASMTGSIPDPLGQLSNRFHVDAVTTTSPGAFAAVAGLFGHDRIVFGSDYPYVPIEATAGGLRELDLDDATVDAIRAGNALNLLGARLP